MLSIYAGGRVYDYNSAHPQGGIRKVPPSTIILYLLGSSSKANKKLDYRE